VPPSWVDRPNRPDNRPNWPDNRPNRPDNRPDRPIIGGGNGNNIGSGNIGSGNVINRPTNNINNNFFNQNNVNINNRWGNNNWGRGGGWGGGWYGGNAWHNNWYHGSWNWWNTGASFAAGTAFGWMLAPRQTIAYSNPYYVAPPATIEVNPVFNYSSPIPVPVDSSTTTEYIAPTEIPIEVDTPAPPPPDSSDEASAKPDDAKAAEQSAREAEAKRIFEEAAEDFKKEDYTAALDKTNKALEQLPSDSFLHEFRALVLFAQKKYQDAAAGIYAVLAVRPGWDWDTMRSFYADPKTYEKQLRALEDFVKENANDGAASFLLAYHYLVLNSKEAAIKQLEHTVKIQPKDELSAQLLKMLQQPPDTGDRPTPRGP
jgi:tetratricopeptide (TPR) repeat protein